MAHSDAVHQHSAGRETKQYGGCVGCSIFTFVIAIIWVSVAIEKACGEMDAFDAEMIDSVTAPLSEALLTQMVPMETAFGQTSGAPWVANVTNTMEKDAGSLIINYFYALISLNSKDLVMVKMQDAKEAITMDTGKSAALKMHLILRSSGAIGAAFREIPANDWTNGYANVRINTDVEGFVDGMSYAIHSECTVPYRLRELPAISQWPLGTGDIVPIRRAITEGLRMEHAKDPPVTALNFDNFQGRGSASSTVHLLIAFWAFASMGLSAMVTLSCWEMKHAGPAEEAAPLADATPPKPESATQGDPSS